MNESTDAELLARFAQSESEEAFATLVHRHVHLVHSVALRHTANAHHAEEITQAVFVILVRKARSLGSKTVLSGWLYHTARLTAANFQRAELRRVHREQEAFMRSTLEETSNDTVWNELSPLLDEAMARLRAGDRDALVMRYFENKTLPEVGAALGVEDRAAQKRVTRALEKLRRLFTKRGVVSTAAIIAAALSAHSVQAAPATCATNITATALQGSAVTATTLTLIKGTLKLMAWTKAKTAVVAGVIVLLTIGTTTVLVKQAADQKLKQSAAVAIERVAQANTGLPAAQTQAKMLIFSAMAQQKIPDAANWCETLNAKGKLWPVTPTNTAFAINSQVAGRAYSRKELSSGSIPGKTVVFFETSNSGWNQAGGSELLPTNAEAVAVAFADGTALIVASGEMASLRWTP
ncbi:MAG TPA: sigma-70 family RNA polymerase sigma factor [Methylomirabilota bacterium]|nr:sigma-70 family RNA polymerase sigma factor [Methylomirabilota bacterium]